MTYVLTLCTIILCFKLVSAFGFKIHLCQVMACETALGKGRAERVEERQESPGGSGKGGAGISPGVPKCLARAAGLVAVGLRQCLPSWHTVASVGLLRHGKDQSS